MPLDLKITGGTLVDGTGALAYVADIGIKEGRVVEIGRVSTPSRQMISAEGALVTPGFIDTHTHYDAQALWDSELINSTMNGVTTVVMGNCGVGCAPLVPETLGSIKALLEGVEDIPGQALDAALDWRWRSFGSYLDRIEERPHAINLAANATHAPIRLSAMGDRALDGSTPNQADIAKMQSLLEEALQAGASAFSTGRIALHQLVGGAHVPDWQAPREELLALTRTLAAFQGRPLQFAADFGGTVGTEEDTKRELSLLSDVASIGVPVFTPVQQYPKIEGGWRRLAAEMTAMIDAGANITFEASARAIGSLMGLELFHPFLRHPSYMAIQHLPLEKRVAVMRDPQVRARLLSEKPTPDPENRIANYKFEIVASHADRIFIVDGTPDYEPVPSTSVKAIADREGKTVYEVFYDALTADWGARFLYLIVFNFRNGNLDEQHAILSLPDTILSFGDAGAHVTAACDFANTTFSLMHWGRDRTKGIRLERLVHQMTGAQAALFNFKDRGVIRPGSHADINIIDLEQLQMQPPRLLRDLPGGGKRLHQGATGYVATLVGGVPVVEKDELTGALPGQLFRRH